MHPQPLSSVYLLRSLVSYLPCPVLSRPALYCPALLYSTLLHVAALHPSGTAPCHEMRTRFAAISSPYTLAETAERPRPMCATRADGTAPYCNHPWDRAERRGLGLGLGSGLGHEADGVAPSV
jgi:hypothetical protein